MEILEPRVTYWKQNDPVSHVTRCARVCYGKDSGNDKLLHDNLILKHHWSMFRHVSYYFITPSHLENLIPKNNPYIKSVKLGSYLYVATNGNFMLDWDHQPLIVILKNYQADQEDFNLHPETKDLIRFTFDIVTQISTSRELNRVSPNNIAERSTRYYDLQNGAIVRPHWMTPGEAQSWNDGDSHSLSSPPWWLYCKECEKAFDNYAKLIEQFDFKKQDARGMLPLDTATEVVYTYSLEEWKHIIELRSSKRAHPNAQIIANMLIQEFHKLGL